MFSVNVCEWIERREASNTIRSYYQSPLNNTFAASR